MIAYIVIAIAAVWLGTALVWWSVETHWNGRSLPTPLRLFRSVTWFPGFLRLRIPGEDRLYRWLLRRYGLGGAE